MPISTTLRKLLCCAPGRQEEAEPPAPPPTPESVEAGPAQAGRPYRDYVEGEADRFGQEEEEAEAPARRPLPEPVEAAPVQPGRPYRDYVEGEADRFRQVMVAAYMMPWEIPLVDHPAPHHAPIYFSIDLESGRPIPDADALIRADYVYVPKDGSRITPDMYIYPWRSPGVMPTANDLVSRGWDACYSLIGEGAGMRLIYHWLTGLLPGEPGITMRVDRLFSPAVSTMHFSPRPPARAEASATRPVPGPARQPADDAVPQRREIPLPNHPKPKHPPVYYMLDPETGRPIPEENSLIRGDFVRRQSDDRHIFIHGNIEPWRQLREPYIRDFLGAPGGFRQYYSLELNEGEICVMLHYVSTLGLLKKPLNAFRFSARSLPRAERRAIPPAPESARQPADDAGSRRREIPLPEHPEPKHPPIYYRLAPVSGRPIPEEDSVIRKGYVRTQDEYQFVAFPDILPWRINRRPIGTDFGYFLSHTRAYYTLELNNGEICVILHKIPSFPHLSRIPARPLNRYLFSPQRTEEAQRAIERHSQYFDYTLVPTNIMM